MRIKGASVAIPGLPLIFGQCLERSIPADDSAFAFFRIIAVTAFSGLGRLGQARCMASLPSVKASV
jgi:hypothetical protein